MDKSPDAFRTISEVAEVLETPAHVLRFWESRFPQIRPVKRAGGRRYYRPSDIALLTGIKRLLHDEGLTIRGVQKILRDHGVRQVSGLGDDPASLDALVASTLEVPGTRDATGAGPAADPPDAGPAPAMEPAPAAASAPDPAAPLPRSGRSDSGLPLFDVPPALGRPEPPVAPPVRLKPTLRDDVTFASRIRALPRGSLAPSAPQLADLARRLAALRARVAARAEGGNG
jgi:DNA-binding transcriptional MerR regulator